MTKGTIGEWLSKLDYEDGIRLRSAERNYAFPENDYDRQYAVVPGDTRIGCWISEELRKRGLQRGAVALELACGTGQLTVGLVESGQFSRLIVSDASTAFLKIARAKLATMKSDVQTDYLRLADVDFDELPEGAVDVVFLRSALHHFDDFSGTARRLISKLTPGGFFAIYEPRAEFFIHSAFLCRLVAERLSDGDSADAKDILRLARLFEDCALFYTSRDKKPAEAEDRYVFFLEEFVDIARESGTVLHLCGGEYDSTFSDAFLGYMRYAMDSTDSVKSGLAQILKEELELGDRLLASRPRYSAAEWYLFQKSREQELKRENSSEEGRTFRTKLATWLRSMHAKDSG